MNNFLELEYKYKANITLKDFKKILRVLRPTKTQQVESWDVYYTKPGNKEEFIRFRNSDNPELTIKKKTKKNNNWKRIEVDLPLNIDKLTVETVDSFSKLLNYKENFRIYKNCFICWFKYVNIVYYETYDENKNYLGTFIEIEINKNQVPKLGKLSFKVLNIVERRLKSLGLTLETKLKQSLFEIYRR